MEQERERRSSLMNKADVLEEVVVERNRKQSLEAQEQERMERVSSNGTAPIQSPLKKCFDALKH